MTPALVTVIMPTLNEAAALGRALSDLRGQDGLAELVVADGGSRDATRSILDAQRAGFESRGIGVVWLETSAGRAAQMNAGAAVAAGGILLFVHADTRLPVGAVKAVREAIDAGHVGGAFRHRFSESGPGLSAVSWWSNLRSNVTHVYFGDQAIFVRRDIFDRMGGYNVMPIMEDLDFTRRLRRLGPTRLLGLSVRTSGRRFVSEGTAATCARMLWLRTAYRLGADPVALKRHYPEIR